MCPQRRRSAVAPALAVWLVASAGAEPPATGDYLAWRQRWFADLLGNPALEATVWGDHADPDGDGCDNLMEFVMVRDPRFVDGQLGLRCRVEGADFVVTYRETTAPNPGFAWRCEWSVDGTFWVGQGVRLATVETHAGHRLIEARISRNREGAMFFRLRVER